MDERHYKSITAEIIKSYAASIPQEEINAMEWLAGKIYERFGLGAEGCPARPAQPDDGLVEALRAQLRELAADVGEMEDAICDIGDPQYMSIAERLRDIRKAALERLNRM